MYTIARIIILLLLASVVKAQAQDASAVELEITNISNDEGQLMIALYDTEESWLNTPYKGIFGKIENGKSTAVFNNIPDGIYAISLYHDEDNDGELDTFLGIPKEDVGSSNNAPARFGPPKWEDAKFEIKGKSIKQNISL